MRMVASTDGVLSLAAATFTKLVLLEIRLELRGSKRSRRVLAAELFSRLLGHFVLVQR